MPLRARAEVDKTRETDKTDEILEVAESLPPMPASLVELSTMMCNPDSDFAEMAAVVANDPTLSGHVLRAANSAAAGGHGAVGVIESAVARLGVAQVLAVGVRAYAAATLSGRYIAYRDEPGSPLDHATSSADAAQSIIRASSEPIGRELVSAALLHDLGKLVLDEVVDAPRLLALSAEMRVIDAERALCGIDHAEVGALVTTSWNLPESVSTAIRYHHDPAAAGEPGPHVIALADAVSNVALGRLERSDPLYFDRAEASAMALGLRVETLDELIDEVRRSAQQRESVGSSR